MSFMSYCAGNFGKLFLFLDLRNHFAKHQIQLKPLEELVFWKLVLSIHDTNRASYTEQSIWRIPSIFGFHSWISLTGVSFPHVAAMEFNGAI